MASTIVWFLPIIVFYLKKKKKKKKFATDNQSYVKQTQQNITVIVILVGNKGKYIECREKELY